MSCVQHRPVFLAFSAAVLLLCLPGGYPWLGRTCACKLSNCRYGKGILHIMGNRPFWSPHVSCSNKDDSSTHTYVVSAGLLFVSGPELGSLSQNKVARSAGVCDRPRYFAADIAPASENLKGHSFRDTRVSHSTSFQPRLWCSCVYSAGFNCGLLVVQLCKSCV